MTFAAQKGYMLRNETNILGGAYFRQVVE